MKYLSIFSIATICLGVSLVSTVNSQETNVRNTTVYTYGPSGGEGGNTFHPIQVFRKKVSIINVRSGRYIDGIQLGYVSESPLGCSSTTDLTRWMGGTGGRFDSVEIACDEYITEITGRSGRYIDSLVVKTNKGRTRSWGGRWKKCLSIHRSQNN